MSSHESLGASHRNLLQNARWRTQPASPGQLLMLKRLGLKVKLPPGAGRKAAKVDPRVKAAPAPAAEAAEAPAARKKGRPKAAPDAESLSKGEASLMIDAEMKRPATPEQRAALRVRGLGRGSCLLAVCATHSRSRVHRWPHSHKYCAPVLLAR